MSLTKGTVVQIKVILYVCFPMALCFITELWKDEKSHLTHSEVEVRGGNRDDAFTVNCVLPGLVIKLWRGAVFVTFLLPVFSVSLYHDSLVSSIVYSTFFSSLIFFRHQTQF